MHIAAASPMSVTKEELSEETIESEKNILESSQEKVVSPKKLLKK